MTSNIGSDLIAADSDANYATLKNRVLEDLRGKLRPEFINRLDDVIVFKPLSRDHIHDIVRLQLAKTQASLGGEKYSTGRDEQCN